MLFVMSTVEPTRGTRPNGETELTWTGTDDRDIELEITAVVTTDDRRGDPIILIIHCMPTALRRAER